MIQLILAMIFVFFLPGYTLINALCPRKNQLDLEYDQLYRMSLGVVLSVTIVIVVGFGLNALGVDPTSGMGYFQASYLWAVLIVLTLVFFFLGVFRGAYPWLGRLVPALQRAPPRDDKSTVIYKREDATRVIELRELAVKREKVKKELQRYEKKLKVYGGREKEIIESKRKRLKGELERLDRRMARLENDIIGDVY